MATPMKPLVQGGSYYPSRVWTPFVRGNGFTTQDGGEEQGVPKTVSGSLLHITDALAGDVSALSVAINPVQSGSGDPSPDNVRPISGHSAVNVYHAGAFNLGADYTGDGFVSGSYLTSTGSTTSNASFNISGYILIDGNVPIFVNIGIDLNAPSICYYDSNKTFISGEKYNHRRTFTATTPENCAYVRMSVETGHTADMGFYDHYTVIPVTIPTPPGTIYGGTLDVTTGVLTVTMANIASYAGESINEPWLSSMDKYVPGATPTTGAQVVYSLAAPVTYQLTPAQLSTLAGENNVWADTGNITMTYMAQGG